MQTLCFLTFIVVTKEYLFAFDKLQDVKCQLFSPNEALNFSGLAEKYGYRSEEYEVITEDGYILGLFRIRGSRGYPILLMHGVTDSSDTWLLRGYTSLGITLARQNYDTWFGNIRGNKYSRRHIQLSPDTDPSFWDYSFHEHGFYDLPAMIDVIVSETGFGKLNAFGHSQGNTIFYVLGSTRPEYNEKINVMTALAPICFLNNLPPPLSLLIKIAPQLNEYLEKIGQNEILGDSLSGKVVKLICRNPMVGYAVCVLGLMFPLCGFDPEEFSSSFFYVLSENYPSTTTRKNFYHFAQIALRGRFSKFDYGAPRNLVEYNSSTPPEYDLERVTMPIFLLAGRNDRLSLLPDVDTLRKRLPNVVKYTTIKRKLMNHLDYIWGANMKKYLFPYIFDILKEYN